MGYWETWIRETGLEKINVGNEVRKALVAQPAVRNLAAQLGPAAERALYGEEEWRRQQTAVTKQPTPEQQAVVEAEQAKQDVVAVASAATTLRRVETVRAARVVRQAAVVRQVPVVQRQQPYTYPVAYASWQAAFAQPSLWWGGWY
ncbi:MAG: hypothetical protein KAT00_12940 [Planctomycetes bacterium]|nr:hypothetical protein [Planctomycetota bacterium]